jgi:hypothetical protein
MPKERSPIKLNFFSTHEKFKMTKLIQQTFDQIAQLPEDQQDSLAIYIQKNLIELLKKSEKEKRIAEQKYTIDDFNAETQQAIKNVEEGKNLSIYNNQDDFYREMGI